MESSGQLFINNVDMVAILIYWTIIWITYMLIYQCAMVVNRGILLYKNIIVITGNIMLFVQLILFTAQTPQMLNFMFYLSLSLKTSTYSAVVTAPPTGHRKLQFL